MGRLHWPLALRPAVSGIPKGLRGRRFRSLPFSLLALPPFSPQTPDTQTILHTFFFERTDTRFVYIYPPLKKCNPISNTYLETLHPFSKSLGEAPRVGTWVNFCWKYAAGLFEPLPHYSLFCGPLIKDPHLSHFPWSLLSKCNFRDHNRLSHCRSRLLGHFLRLF